MVDCCYSITPIQCIHQSTICAYLQDTPSVHNYTLSHGFVILKLNHTLLILSTYAFARSNLSLPFSSHPSQHASGQSSPICALAGSNPWCMDCLPDAGTPIAYINDTYPLIQLYQVNSENPDDLLQFVNNGTCVGAVMTVNQWNTVVNFKGTTSYDSISTCCHCIHYSSF